MPVLNETACRVSKMGAEILKQLTAIDHVRLAVKPEQLVVALMRDL